MPYEYSIDCPSLTFDTAAEYRSVRVVVTEVFLDFDPVLFEDETNKPRMRGEYPSVREADAQ